jgi:uncharacterized DUF497 family protein
MTQITFNFDWDPVKAQMNRSKHGVRFEQAATIFRDPLMVTVFDEEHSLDEERWITIGRADEGDLLVVIHTFQEVRSDQVAIRLISARHATSRERQRYEAQP